MKHDLNILDYLPHRYPFLLVDRVESYNIEEQTIKAYKNLSYNEDFFNGHFPTMPVMPGVLMIEALAQASGILIFQLLDVVPDFTKDSFLLVGVDGARFKRMVVPGDQLMLECQLAKKRSELFIFDAKASVAGEVACTAQIMIQKITQKETVND